jgi:hypothetical protein
MAIFSNTPSGSIEASPERRAAISRLIEDMTPIAPNH